MLQPGDFDRAKVPYELKTQSRTGRRGRRKAPPEKELRDWLIFKNVEKRMSEIGRGSYDAAIKEVADLDGLDVYTVRRAYDRIRTLVDDAANKPDD